MLWITIVVHFLLDFSTSIFQPLGPYVVQKYSIDVKTFAMALYFVSLLSSVTQPIFGVITDRISRRNVYLAIVAAITFLFSSFVSIAGTFVLFITFAFIAQLANSAFHPMGASIAGDKRKENIAFFTLSGMFGYAVGPVFITWYAEHFKLKGYYLAGIFMAVFALVTLTRFHNLRVERKRIKINLKGLKILLPIMFFVAFRSFSMGIAQIYGPMYAKMLGRSLIFGGSLLTLTRFVGMVLSTSGVFIGKKIGNAIINVFSAGLMMLFGLLFVFVDLTKVHEIWFLIIFVAMLSPAYLSMSSTVVEAQKRLPKNPGLASAVTMGFSWAMGSLMNLVYSSFFGNDVKFMINSFWIVSAAALGMAVWDFLTSKSQK